MLLTVVLALGIGPLIGIWLMEQGAFAPNLGVAGHPNGATVAFATYFAAALFTYWLTMGAGRMALTTRPAAARSLPSAADRARFNKLALTVIVVNVVYVLFLLFVVGALAVVRGDVDKGEFRASFGALGAPVYFSQVVLIPMLAALVSAMYRRMAPTWVQTTLLAGVVFLTALGGSLWGYKASAIVAVIPALVILFPRVTILRSIAATLLGFLIAIPFAMLFQHLNANDAAFAVSVRATLGSGDTPWYVWDLHANSVRFPPYLPTLASGLGGRLAAILGIASRTDQGAWNQYDYAATLTLVVKDFARGANPAFSNVTGTPFAEGVMALGSPGFLLFAAGAGLVAALNNLVLLAAARSGRLLLTALAATYFGAATMPWLNGGGVVVLLNVPFAGYFAVACIFCLGLLGFCGLLSVQSPAGSGAKAPSPLRQPA